LALLVLLVLPILALTAAGPLRASTLAPLAGAGPLRPGAVAALLVALRAPILALGCCPAAVALAGAVGDCWGRGFGHKDDHGGKQGKPMKVLFAL